MPDPPDRLDEALDERRVALGLQWNDVARLAQISLKTLDRIRKGGGTKLTRRALENALRLAPGSIETAVDGGELEVAPDPPPLTEEQQQLKDVYEFYLRKYGAAEALARISRDVDEINAARERRSRAAG